MDQKLKPCERWWQFYGLWLRVALTASLSVADLVGFIVGLLVPLIHALFPRVPESTLTPLLWKIPLGVFCCVGAIRLVIAPYLIYRDRHLSAKQEGEALRQVISE